MNAPVAPEGGVVMTPPSYSTVDFYGDILFAVEMDDGVAVAVKPIVERLGLAWHGQFERIQRDAVLSEGNRVTRMPTPGGAQDMVCLPLELIPGFLFGINDRRIKPELRETVLRYKRECHAALFRHFFGARPAAVSPESELIGGIAGETPLDEKRFWLATVVAAGRIFGTAASQRLWLRSPLPTPDALPDEPPADEVERFLGEATERRADGQIGASTLYACYRGWCVENRLPPLSQAMFGRQLSLRGIPGIKGGHNHTMIRAGIGWGRNIYWAWGVGRPALTVV